MRDMTAVEKRHIEKNHNCPACQGELMGGPEGGACKNFKCASCYRVWNLCFAFGGGIFTGQLVYGDEYLTPVEQVEAHEPRWRKLLHRLVGR